MKRVILLVVIAACSGGTTSKPPTKPTTSGANGLIWETPAEPWHVVHPSRAVLVTGDVGTFGGGSGWVFQVDLRTGALIRETKLAMGTVTSLLDLADNRILAVGFATSDLDAPAAAFTLDPVTLASTPVKLPILPGKPTFVTPHAALVADGGVAISGRGLPLSIYDSKTWAVRATLDNTIGWSQLAARGEILIAAKTGALKRFNVDTNGQRELPYGVTSHLVVADGAAILRVARSGLWIVELHLEDKTVVVPQKEQVASLHPYDDKHYITTLKNEIRIHELPSGEIKKRITVDDGDSYLRGIAIANKRAVVATGGVIRVIDLETGAVTPKQPGARQAPWLAVANDGSVLAGEDHQVWTVAGGKIGAIEPIEEGLSIDLIRSDDPRHYVISKVTGATGVTVRTFGDKAPRTLSLETAPKGMWLARDGSLVLNVEGERSHRIMRAKTTSAEVLFAYNSDSDVLAVDPDDDILLALDGRVAVVGQDGRAKSTLRIPHCERSFALGVAEPGGSRAITYDNRDFALWDRKTGKLIANAKVDTPEDVLFLPRREEVVIVLDDRVVLWTPNKGTRTLKLAGVLEPAVSADGKKLALSFNDGRIAVYELDALIAATPLGPDLAAGDPIPETCGEVDPLEIPQSADDDPPPPEEEDRD